MASEIDMRLAKRIRQARNAARLTGDEVHARTGIGPATLSLIENGKQPPSIAQLRALARVFHVSAADLIGGSSRAA